MPLDLETIFALHTMRQGGQSATAVVEEDLLLEQEEDLCPICGSLLFESEDDYCALLCPFCDAHSV